MQRHDICHGTVSTLYQSAVCLQLFKSKLLNCIIIILIMQRSGFDSCLIIFNEKKILFSNESQICLFHIFFQRPQNSILVPAFTYKRLRKMAQNSRQVIQFWKVFFFAHCCRFPVDVFSLSKPISPQRNWIPRRPSYI